MRVHAAHVPQASRASPSPTGDGQFIACATAIAVVRMPAPAGPEKIRLGGSASRATDRASSAASRAVARRRRPERHGLGRLFVSDTAPYRCRGGAVSRELQPPDEVCATRAGNASSFRMSEKTPIAVTSAPAPGPCTTSGVLR